MKHRQLLPTLAAGILAGALLIGCPMGPASEESSDGDTESTSNSAPYPITATDPPDEDESTEEVDLSFSQYPIAPSTVQLVIDKDSDGNLDPDSDTVYYRSGTLPSYMTLDEGTGEITLAEQDNRSNATVEFWSEDEHGLATDGNPLVVNFTFGSS